MKICAIICEYNPFHNGHQYQIDTLKNKYGIDKIIGIMSGNFVQRGDPSIMDKYTRAKIAIECGCDMVVGIPTPYTLSSAEIFAIAGVKIASSIQGVTHISFGCETENISILYKLADYLSVPNESFEKTYTEYIKSGKSHPQSTSMALVDMVKCGDIDFALEKEIMDIVSKPNNILALEYLKAIKHTNLTPIILQRTSNYHTHTLTSNTSAKAIREYYYTHTFLYPIKKAMPQVSYDAIIDYKTNYGRVKYDTYHTLLLASVKMSNIARLQNTFDVEDGLEHRLLTTAQNTGDYDTFFGALSTKRYTNARLKRILICHLLGITKEHTIYIKEHDIPYIKVLAMKNDKLLLKAISSTKNLVIRTSDADKFAKQFEDFVSIEDRANQLYGILLPSSEKFLSRINKDIYTLPYIQKQ